MNHNRNSFNSLQVFELLQHHWQGNFRFQSCQWSAYTEVNTMPIGQVAIWFALDIEALWIGEACWIAIGRCCPGKHDLVGRNVLPCQINICFGLSEEKPYWW